MHLALNSMVYEAGNVDAGSMLRKAKEFGFTYIDFNAWRSGDPTAIGRADRREILQLFRDLGLRSSQLLMINTRELASSDARTREKVQDYMKACTDFQLELGGRQVLICWGAGVYESDVSREQTWLLSVSVVRGFANWCRDKGVIVEMELDPHVYFVLNNLNEMVRMLEAVDLPNLFSNVDIGHLCITREAPKALEKIRSRILHAHISETDTFEHTNSIIGSGRADFPAYIRKLQDLGIEENCRRNGVPAVVDIEMGEPGRFVDDPDRWVRESLECLKRQLPDLRP
jgi:sugar phosphate isomerase/epimerase